MKVTLFGTRGSLPVSGPQYARYGGNTTSLRIESSAIPRSMVLAVDAGSGFLPLVRAALAEGRNHWIVLHTHYHLDHVHGLVVSAPLNNGEYSVLLVGPIESGQGPADMYKHILDQPFHPVPFSTVASRVEGIGIDDPSTLFLLVHPEHGFHAIAGAEPTGTTVKLPGGAVVDVKDCLVIKSFVADHPNRTLMYRFDDKRSGRSVVFMTDEEVRDPIPAALIDFLKGTHLLIADAQYSVEEYGTGARKGWGHGTPKYAIDLARECGIPRVALTHHDPLASDDDLDRHELEAQKLAKLYGIECVACKDGSVFEA